MAAIRLAYCGYDYDIDGPLRVGFITADNDAEVSILGIMTQAEFDALDPTKLPQLNYSADAIQNPSVGQVLAVKTSRGNFAKVQIIKMSDDGFNRTYRYTTYQIK